MPWCQTPPTGKMKYRGYTGAFIKDMKLFLQWKDFISFFVYLTQPRVY